MKPKIENKAEKIAFLMPGQGSFNDTLLMELVQEYSTLKPYVEVANSIIRKYLGKDLANVLQPDYTGKFEKIESDFELSQCVIFLLDYFYYHLLVQQGIKPDFIVGHSVGEIPALTAAGAFSFEEGLQIICHRTIAVRDYSKTGKMLAVFCDVDRIKSLLKFLSNSDLTLAVINGNQQLVVSGMTVRSIKLKAW